MAFTKINAAGIGTTETVTVDGLTVINDGSFGGNLSVGGTITYEDVTNVDSVGIITARAGVLVGSGITLSKDGDIFATGITTVSGNVKVGTGITLSPDGDVFFTGIATGNGSGLTALNASNLGSGTVPTARLGSGTASSSTFLRGDSTFQTVNTDLVSDTSPQLGGGLESNGFNINFADSSGTNNMAKFGASGDLQIYHDSVHSRIVDTGTGDLKLQTSKLTIGNSGNSETMAVFTENGAVELYHDNVKTLYTDSDGVVIGQSSYKQLKIDGQVGDCILASSGAELRFTRAASSNITCSDASGSLNIIVAGTENAAKFINNGAVELYHNNEKKLYTYTDGVFVQDDSSAGAYLVIATNAGTQGSLYGTANTLGLLDGQNHYMLKGVKDGALELYYDNSKKLETTSTGIETVEAVKMTHGGNGVNLKIVHEAGVGNTGTTTATVPDCVGGGTVTVTVMHNGNTSITTTKMFPFMARGNSTANLGSEIFSINHLSTASFSVSAATLGVTVTNNTGNHAKVRVTFDITANV